MYSHLASRIGNDADEYVAAAGHYGNKSRLLLRHFAEDCGYTYLHAETKDEFLAVSKIFISPEIDKSIIFEVFTNSDDESDSLKIIDHLMFSESQVARKNLAKNILKDILGKKTIDKVKDILHN